MNEARKMEQIAVIQKRKFLILGALIMTIFVGRVWPLREFFKVAEIQSKPSRLFWLIIIQYFAPITIIIIWLTKLGIIKF